AFGHTYQRREVALDVRRVEARHHHRPLSAPACTVCAEDAVEPHAVRDPGYAARALEAVRAIAQQRADRLRIGDDHDLPARIAEAVDVAVLPLPALHRAMQPREVELEEIADERQTGRAGEFADLHGFSIAGPAKLTAELR